MTRHFSGSRLLLLAAAIVTCALVRLPATASAQGFGLARGPAPESSHAEGSTIYFPLVARQYTATPCEGECCRFGTNFVSGPIESRKSITDYDLDQLGPIGWYQNWSVQAGPDRPGGVEFVQLIRLRSSPGSSQDHWPPNWAQIEYAIQRNPGALWLIGNEPDVESQDNCTPQEYAERYHQCYTFIKGLDASAQVSAAGIVQPSELRLEWLDRARTHYQTAYGTAMPVDVWNIHIQILPERRGHGAWGCGIPPGLPDYMGEDHQVADNADLGLFKAKVVQFRTWMRDRGERDKPLTISEYGVLMPSGFGYLGGADKELGDTMVKNYMVGTFDHCLAASDPQLGYARDDDRLVQRWAWYSLNDRLADLEADVPYFGFNGGLYAWDQEYPGVLTQFGETYRDYLQTLGCSTP